MGSGVQARLLHGAWHLENALFGLILCSHRLEVLNHFLQGAPHFHFVVDPANYIAGPGCRLPGAVTFCLS